MVYVRAVTITRLNSITRLHINLNFPSQLLGNMAEGRRRLAEKKIKHLRDLVKKFVGSHKTFMRSHNALITVQYPFEIQKMEFWLFID